MRRRTLILAGAAASAVMAAVLLPAAAAAPSVVVFAAASLKNALDAVAAKWRSSTGREATISYAASSTLAKQIENGAPADLFVSADEKWMDYLQQRKLILPQSRVDLLGNRLVLIAPKGSSMAVAIAPGFPLAKLIDGERLAMADPAAVPAGLYGKEALQKLGVWNSVADRIAAAENVRAALALVARGEAPFGIVYQTDATIEPAVKIVGTFPADSHPPIVYPMALAATARPGAADFAAFLRSPVAAAVFSSQGFSVRGGAR